MKNIMRTLLVVMVLALVLAVFAACNLSTPDPQPTTQPECEHTGGTATCENAAVCEKCGESYGEKAEHTLVTVDGKEATCTEDGLTEGQYCSVCMEVVVSQSVIEAPGHVEVIDEAKAPTCTETGLTEGKHCSVCDMVFVAQTEVPVVAHTYDEGQWDADCNVCGATRTCAHNGNKTVVEGKAPTCTEAGLTNGEKCAVCGEVTKNQETIPALGHTEVIDAAVTPDCENTGLTEGKHCSVCNEVLVAQQTVDALGHKEEAIPEVKADCLNSGLTEGKKCSVCGEIIVAQERIPALGHTEVVDAAKAPTCTETGLTEGKHCSVCNTVLVAQETVAAEGHKDENVDYECDVCHIDLCTDHIPAEAVRENEVASTCTVAGSYESVVKCSRCGEEISRETLALPLAAHTDEEIPKVEPDCENTGLTAGTKCSVCGTVTKEQTVVPAYGHVDTKVPGKAPTCEATGLKDGSVCSVCGKTTLAQEEIPALGHNYGEVTCTWSDDNSTCTAAQVCANDAAHVVKEVTTVSTVTLNVTATKVTYTYTAGTQTKTVEADVTLVDSIATINAPAIAGRVASHDYVKFGFHDAAATYTFTIYYSEVDVWDGVSVSTSLAGTGTAEDPYLVQSGADLAYIASVVNGAAAGTTNFNGQYFKMTKSIDLNGKELKIGSYTAGTRFYGFFDGNNCTVRGINATQSLFGMLYNGYIKNLSTYGTVTTTEKKGVAGLVSYMTGATVENITNYVNVTGIQQVAGVVGWLENNTTTFAKNCVNYGTVYATSYQIGGIAGFAKGTLADCTNFGDVTSTASGYVGGIGGAAKDAKGSRSNCVNYGNISAKSYIGGCFGQITATTTNCYSYGTVKLVSGSDANIGEVVGSGANYLTYTE